MSGVRDFVKLFSFEHGYTWSKETWINLDLVCNVQRHMLLGDTSWQTDNRPHFSNGDESWQYEHYEATQVTFVGGTEMLLAMLPEEFLEMLRPIRLESDAKMRKKQREQRSLL